MHSEFWHSRWQTNNIPFHQPETNRYLQQYLPQKPKTQARAFVPLCGKSLDIYWLHQQGWHVVGVELSDIAIQGFFKTHQLDYQVTVQTNYKVYTAAGICLYQANLFDIDPQTLGEFNFIYDCKALIALPKDMRARYANFINQLPRTANSLMLLISLEYLKPKNPTAVEAGGQTAPPFEVKAAEVQKLYKDWQLLQTQFLDVDKDGKTQDKLYLLKPS